MTDKFQRRKSITIVPDSNKIKKTLFVGLEMKKSVDINFANNTRNIENIFKRENENKVKQFFNRRKYRIFELEEIESFAKFHSEQNDSVTGSPIKIQPTYEAKRIITSCTTKLGDLIGSMTKSEIFNTVQTAERSPMLKSSVNNVNGEKYRETASKFSVIEPTNHKSMNKLNNMINQLPTISDLKLDRKRRGSRQITIIPKLSLQSSEAIREEPLDTKNEDSDRDDDSNLELVKRDSRIQAKKFTTKSKNKLPLIAGQSKMKIDAISVIKEVHEDIIITSNLNRIVGRGFNLEEYNKYHSLQSQIQKKEMPKPLKVFL